MLDYMIANYKTMEYSEIGKHLGLTSKQVRTKMSQLGYRKNRTFNNRYFEHIDNSTKAKTPMGIQCNDPNIEINMDGMADSVPLKDSYFNIKNTLNISRDVDIKIYPEAMANDLSQYAITIHLVINKYDTP